MKLSKHIIFFITFCLLLISTIQKSELKSQSNFNEKYIIGESTSTGSRHQLAITYSAPTKDSPKSNEMKGFIKAETVKNIRSSILPPKPGVLETIDEVNK